MGDVIAFAVGPDGKSRETQPAPMDALKAPEGGYVWVHVNMSGAEGQSWLEGSGHDAFSRSALSLIETRPRCLVHGEAALVFLRGVNLNPGAEQEDMVALRLYLSDRLVVTTHRRDVIAVQDVIAALSRGAGPVNTGELLGQLALRLSERADPIVAALNERIDDLEEVAPEEIGVAPMRGELADVRREAILLRRYMFPQRDALAALEIEDFPWLTAHAHMRLREAADRATRLAEDLDAIRDRAQVVHDQVMDMRAEAMNRQMLLLSVVSAIFLPITFITGLLGINVGGIPGAHSPLGFWSVAAILLVIALGLIGLFWKMGYLGRR
ncbi:MAG: zinc transporter ZntB [Maritimibacter sp.]